GVFTHEISRGAHLQINVLGWGYDSLKQLTQTVERSIEPASGGLLHVYAIETAMKHRVTKGHKFMQTIDSNFLFLLVGTTFQPSNQPPDQPSGGASDPVDRETRQYFIQTLNNLAVQYDLLESDDHTSAEELKRYLDLAEFLGLFDKSGRAAF